MDIEAWCSLDGNTTDICYMRFTGANGKQFWIKVKPIEGLVPSKSDPMGDTDLRVLGGEPVALLEEDARAEMRAGDWDKRTLVVEGI